MVSPILLSFIVAVAAIWLISKFLTWYKKIRQIDEIGGPPMIPILGNLLDVLLVPPEEFITAVSKLATHDRPMTRFYLTRALPYVICHKAETVEDVLSSNKIITKSNDYDFLVPWLGTGLLISTGKKWFSRRKMLTPAFHFVILEDFVDVFNRKSQILVKKLSKLTDGRVFDMYNYVTLCTLDIILETAMGLDIDTQNNSESPYVRAVKDAVGIVQRRQKTPWLHSDFLFSFTSDCKRHEECLRIMHDLSLTTIKEKRRKFEEEKVNKKEVDENFIQVEGTKKRLPFLDLLLQYSEKTNLSDEDIREEVDTFMFEGHDTTATAINMTLYLLGTTPHIQKKVHEELDAVFGDADDFITSDKLKELKYLECCIKETLRIFPSVPLFGRQAEDDVKIGGKVVPKDTQVLVFAYQLHRDPQYFPDPETFNPDRFLPENSVGRHAYAYVPFSAGPRNCIGQKFAIMEEKVVLASVLRRFEVNSVDDREKMKMMGEIIMRPKDGVRVTLKERSR